MYFTPRETQILDRMRLGETYKEIGHALTLSGSGIKTRMSDMCRREGFNGTANALALYVEWRSIQKQLGVRG